MHKCCKISNQEKKKKVTILPLESRSSSATTTILFFSFWQNIFKEQWCPFPYLALLPHSSPHHSTKTAFFKSPTISTLPNIVVNSQSLLNLASHCHMALLVTSFFLEHFSTGVGWHRFFLLSYLLLLISLLFCFSLLFLTSNAREPQVSVLICLIFPLLIPKLISFFSNAFKYHFYA